MVSRQQAEETNKKVLQLLNEAGIAVTEEEKGGIEIADFGLSNLEKEGLQIITYVNTDRYCAKELMLLPYQTCPEHRHPDVGGQRGKQETFRCRWGIVYLYVPGEPASNRKCDPPASEPGKYTVSHEIILTPGRQYTIEPDTLHWFQAGPLGAVVSEFSSTSRDESDIFTDPKVVRV